MLSSIRARVNLIRISRLETALLFLLLVFGAPMILLIPPGAGYDEEDHLVRVWELSAFSLIPGRMSPQEMQYPVVFRNFAYRQQGSTGILDAAFWQRFGRAGLYEDGIVRRELNTKSVYSPALLLPQALAMRLGRQLHLPALTAFYLARFASLISYLLLAWLALRVIPFGKWILLVLAATPMALFQAATVSPDAISNGVGFLFIAGCLRAAQLAEIDGKEARNLVILIFLLLLGKINLLPIVVLPFLLLPPARFRSKRTYILLLITAMMLFLVEAIGWYMLATMQAEPLMANDANPVAQLRYLLSHPLAFPQLVITDLLKNGWIYLQGWINGYGYYYWTPPLIVLLFFLLSLGTGLLHDATSEQVDRKTRWILVFVFLLGYLATAGVEYTTFTTPGLDEIYGMQGRYFVPLMLLLVLAAASLSWWRKFSLSSPTWVIVCLTVALSLNIVGLYLSFHVLCGSTYYQTGLCYQPLFKDFSGEVHLSPPVSGEVTLTQQIQVGCDGLTELRLLIVPSAPGDGGVTRFTLQDATSGQTLLHAPVLNNQITSEDFHALPFAPDWHSAGKQYMLTITGTDTPAGQGLQFLYTPQSEFDLGDLSENGEPLREDLVLQYGCATGLRKNWSTGQAPKP